MRSPHKIVYTSRTHAQLTQAMKELKATEYAHLKGVAMGSRDQLCINEDVKKASTTSSARIHLCRAKVKTKRCGYHGGVESAMKSPLIANHTVLDIEDLVKVGKACNACPYYMAQKLAIGADIVFLPYNYVLDPRQLTSPNVKLSNSVVIFDEGHNVGKVCEDAASAKISSTDVACVLDDISYITASLVNNGDKFVAEFAMEDCESLKEMVTKLEHSIYNISGVTDEGMSQSGSKIFDLFDSADMTQQNCKLISDLIDQLLDYIASVGDDNVFSERGQGLMKLGEVLAAICGSMRGNVESWRNTVERGYRVHFEFDKARREVTVKTEDSVASLSSFTPCVNDKVVYFMCLDPSIVMSKLMAQGVHSLIMTSGTLSPLQPLISELAVEFSCRLENPHIIKSTQVMARIISKGPDNTPLVANFENRENSNFVHSMSLTIKSIATITPHGLLIFFPSYTLMSIMQQMWQKSGMWQAINEIKPIYTEPRNKEEFDRCLEKYYASVKIGRGAIFMAVLRGKVSEGMDFKDQNGRAVIVVGLPFPPLNDPYVILKQQYLNSKRKSSSELQSGKEWYVTEATRAVNQAIGRVVRHKKDYGAIFFCDERFHKHVAELSQWIRNEVKGPRILPDDFKAVMKRAGNFFLENGAPHVNRQNLNVLEKSNFTCVDLISDSEDDSPGNRKPNLKRKFSAMNASAPLSSPLPKKQKSVAYQSSLSQPKQRVAFYEELQTKAADKGSSNFSRAELKEIAEELGITKFNEIIDRMNHDSQILMTAGGYKLAIP